MPSSSYHLIKVSNISQSIQGDLIYQLFNCIGPVSSFIILQADISASIVQTSWEAILSYPSDEYLAAAIRLSGLELGDKKIIVVLLPVENDDISIVEKVEKTSRTIYLTNLPYIATEIELTRLFLKESLGKIMYARVFSGWPSMKSAADALRLPKYASIEMESNESALRVIRRLNVDSQSPVCWFSKDIYFSENISNRTSSQITNTQPLEQVAKSAVSSTNPLYAGLPEEALKRKMHQISSYRPVESYTRDYHSRRPSHLPPYHNGYVDRYKRSRY